MKRSNTHIRLCATIAALLLPICLFASCSAAPGGAMDEYPDYSVNENGSAGWGDSSSGDVKPGESTGEYDRKIIRTVNMTCESKAFDAAVTAIMTALEANGGYVEASSSSGTGVRSASADSYYTADGRRATYTLRVPAEKLDAFLTALRTDEGIHITQQSISSNEITASYYDIQTRLETLEAEKDSLTAMLEGFTSYDDINAMLQVQERLYNVIEEMEALRTKLNLYDSQVAMSTVNLTLHEVVEYTVEEEEEPTFGERISEAFTESWTDFAEGCQNFAVFFVRAFPTLLVLAVIGAAFVGGILIVVAIVRKIVKKNL